MSNLSVEAKAKGKFRVQKRNVKTGEIYFDSGDFNNTLLNNFFAEKDPNLYACFVGTDSVVNESDTTMSVIGSYTGSRVTSATASVDANGLVTWNYINTYTFNHGQIVGNMSCIGLAESTTISGNYLKIKSLIKDVNGNPTTIPATASDQIIVTHTLIVTFNQHQVLPTISIDGIDYQVDFYGTYAATGPEIGTSLVGSAPVHYFSSGVSTIYAKIGAAFTPPAIPFTPFGSHSISGTPISSYTNGSALFDAANKKLIGRWVLQIPATLNLASNAPIKFVAATSSTGNQSSFFTYVFTPALPKDSTIAYTITLDLSLSRA